MKVIYNNILPFKGFVAINIFGVIFVRKKYKEYLSGSNDFSYIINHELIHTAQMKELLYIGFYIWYFVEWIIQVFINIKDIKPLKKAYYQIKFEKEAYIYQYDKDYLKTRKHYNWLKL